MLFSKKYALISGVNGEIEYDIIKGDPYAVFKIDKSTGSISVGKQLDYEQIPVYNIVIQAQDRGFYPKSATSSVKIILLDVNDNPPTFDETLFEAVLKENSPPGTFVTQMIANDLDSPKNADISYGKILSAWFVPYGLTKLPMNLFFSWLIILFGKFIFNYWQIHILH